MPREGACEMVQTDSEAFKRKTWRIPFTFVSLFVAPPFLIRFSVRLRSWCFVVSVARDCFTFLHSTYLSEARREQTEQTRHKENEKEWLICPIHRLLQKKERSLSDFWLRFSSTLGYSKEKEPLSSPSFSLSFLQCYYLNSSRFLFLLSSLFFSCPRLHFHQVIFSLSLSFKSVL